MLLPRFSLRTTLLGTTAFALFFLVLGQAFREKPWAIVIAVAVISLALILIIHALLYIFSQFLARLVGTKQLPARTFQGGVQSSSDEQSPPALEIPQPEGTADSATP